MFFAATFAALGDYIVKREPVAVIVKDDTMTVLRYHTERPKDSKLC